MRAPLKTAVCVELGSLVKYYYYYFLIFLASWYALMWQRDAVSEFSQVLTNTWLCSRAMRFQSRPTNWPSLTIESPVAQWLEHPTRSRRVVGSSPIWGSDFSIKKLFHHYYYYYYYYSSYKRRPCCVIQTTIYFSQIWLTFYRSLFHKFFHFFIIFICLYFTKAQ